MLIVHPDGVNNKIDDCWFFAGAQRGGEHIMTRYLTVKPENPDPEAIAAAAAVVRSGGTVAFPTETVYGLGANGLDPEAVEGIFIAKGRPRRNPLILHVASTEQALRLVTDWPVTAASLAARFWPGPLTLILPRAAVVPDLVTAGLPNVALRMPAHPVALALIERSGVPIAAPSANLSGRPSPTLAEHVLADLDQKIDLILDGGPAAVGVESTILSLTGQWPVLLRPGGVTLEDLEQVLGKVLVHDTALPGKEAASAGATPDRSADLDLEPGGQAAPCPGTLFRHYAPRAEALVVTGDSREQEAKVGAYLTAHPDRQVALLATTENAPVYLQMAATGCASGRLVQVEVLGSRSRPEEIASRIFSALRRCDQAGAQVILMEAIPLSGIGLAVMNRLWRAAAKRTI
jgi:L-threonylcarbamoyladenylate synthase